MTAPALNDFLMSNDKLRTMAPSHVWQHKRRIGPCRIRRVLPCIQFRRLCAFHPRLQKICVYTRRRYAFSYQIYFFSESTTLGTDYLEHTITKLNTARLEFTMGSTLIMCTNKTHGERLYRHLGTSPVQEIGMGYRHPTPIYTILAQWLLPFESLHRTCRAVPTRTCTCMRT